MRLRLTLLPLIGSTALVLGAASARAALPTGGGALPTGAGGGAGPSVEEAGAPGAVAPPVSWTWPVVGPVIRPFDPPDDPYGSGHRGIDIAASAGTPVLAPADGVVSFAGPIGGHLFVTIDHGGGLLSSSSWLSGLSVREGDVVSEGQAVGLSGPGHPGSSIPHLHFGVRLDGSYVDPLQYLGPLPVVDLIRLAPIEEAA